MRILLDESLPKRLKRNLKDYFVKTVPEMGWQGKKNGELMSLMSKNFDVFITVDQNLQYQINLRNTNIPIVVISTLTNRYEDIERLIPQLLMKLKSTKLAPVTRIA